MSTVKLESPAADTQEIAEPSKPTYTAKSRKRFNVREEKRIKRRRDNNYREKREDSRGSNRFQFRKEFNGRGKYQEESPRTSSSRSPRQLSQKTGDSRQVVDRMSMDRVSSMSHCHKMGRCYDASSQHSNEIVSHLEHGIEMVTEKLENIRNSIEDVETSVDTSIPTDIETTVAHLVDSLKDLDSLFTGYYENTKMLKTMQHPEANRFYRRVKKQQRRQKAHLDRLTTQILVRLHLRKDILENQRQVLFSGVDECISWIRAETEKLTAIMERPEKSNTLKDVFEEHELENRKIQDFRRKVDECIARQDEVSADCSADYCELLRVLDSGFVELRDLSERKMLELKQQLEKVKKYERKEREERMNPYNEENLKASKENEKLREANLKLKAENETNERMIQKLLDRIASSSTNTLDTNQIHVKTIEESTPTASVSSQRAPLVIDCLICSSQLNSGQEVSRCTLCKRRFHSNCAFKWLEDNSQCPACNGDLPAI